MILDGIATFVSRLLVSNRVRRISRRSVRRRIRVEAGRGAGSGGEVLEQRTLLSATVLERSSFAGSTGVDLSDFPISSTGSSTQLIPLIDSVDVVGGGKTKGGIGIQTVESSPLIRLDDFRADPRFSSIDGSGFSVVIIDTGIDRNHPYFGGDLDSNGISDQIVYSYDFSGANDSDASDTDGHGSNVASITAGSGVTNTGMAPGANIIALKVFPDFSGSASAADIEEAMQWVVANAGLYNIASVNLSLGFGHFTTATSDFLSDEFAALVAQDVMVVAAAGNSYYGYGSTQGVGYPAADPNALAVGAVYDANIGGVGYGDGSTAFTTGPDRITPFSQRSGAMTAIFAPGAAITGANQSGGTVVMHGTSQAAPHIAGIAALAQELAVTHMGRRLTQAEFKSLMQTSGVTINDGDDEDDNVTNTGLNFKRVDVFALGEAILAMADDYGDSYDTAFATRIPSYQGGKIEAPGDADYFEFYAEAGQSVTLRTYSRTLSDTTLTLYGTDGTSILAFNDDIDFDSGNLASWIDYTFGSAGTYYVAARGFSTLTGTYELDIIDDVLGLDDYGNDAITAQTLAAGNSLDGDLEVGGDHDWFDLYLLAGHQYRFTTVLGSLEDSTLTLIDRDGSTPLDFDDDGGPGLASDLLFTPTTTGTYYVRVGGFSSLDAGTYELITTDDDFGGTAVSAEVVTGESSTSGTLELAGDQDWFQFHAIAGFVYMIDNDRLTLSDSTLSVYGSNGHTLVARDSSGPGNDQTPHITFIPRTTGWYYVSVTGYIEDPTETGTYLLSIDQVNHAPVLDTDGSPTLDPIIQNVENIDNPGTLIGDIIARMSPDGGIEDVDPDFLQGVAINGLTGTATGSWQYSTNGGTTWTTFTVSGNANARLLAADGDTRIRYVPNTGFLGQASFAFVAWDRTSGLNGATANVTTRGGATAFSQNYDYASINVVNVAPELDADGTPTLDTILTNVFNVNNPGTLVSTILLRMLEAGGISDANPGALQGIAINGLLNTDKGSWQFTTNGGTSWISIGTTGNSNARLLAADANTRIRFVPIAGFAGTASFAFVAWDRTTGANGGIASVGTRGGSTAYSTAFDYASVSVVNAAPVLNDLGAPLLDGILPDTPDASNPGTLVSTIMSRMSPGGSVTDANPSALRGIAIIGKTATATGTWEYSINNGTTWLAINATGGANALLLASDANTRVRYRPNAGFRGEAKIAFTAWDQTTGTNGGTVNASTRGGTTAFSLAYEYASIFVNTAPTLDASGTPTLDAIPNTISNVANIGTPVNTILNRMAPGGITDPDPGALRGMAIIGLTGTANGTWQYTINNGTNWSNILTTGSANALLLSNTSTTKIRFVPNPGFVGTASIAFTAWDRTQGVNGATVNAGLRGGATPFSSLFDYAAISVTG